MIEQGEIIGLTESLAEIPFETEIEIFSDCLLEYISREDFIAFLQEERKVRFRLARLLASNLRKSYEIFCFSAFILQQNRKM